MNSFINVSVLTTVSHKSLVSCLGGCQHSILLAETYVVLSCHHLGEEVSSALTRLSGGCVWTS